MLYLIQENIFAEKHHERLIHNIERMGLEYELVKIIPFMSELELKTDRKDVFVFGAVKMAHIANKYMFSPGSMYNGNHDFEVYGPKYGGLMLNHGAHIMDLSDPLPVDTRWDMFFARPCGDNKIFTGQVFMRHSWEEFIGDMLKPNKRFDKETEEEMNERLSKLREEKVMLSRLKEIGYEIRCWIVGGKVVTMSMYRLGRRTVYANMDHEDWIRDKVQSYVDIYQPAEAFVMDVCMVEGDEELKIVEINCINCSGFYDANMGKLLNAIEEHFNED